jgi:transketolase
MKISEHVIYPFEKEESLRTRYGETLAKLGEHNSNIVVLDADLSSSTQTIIFKKKYPQRHFDIGIAEADMMGTAAGLSTTQLIPFASSFAMFAIGRAYEQIRNAIAYADLPVKIVATHAGITVGEDGGSHQMIEDIAMMRVLPNMNVIVPVDAVETEEVIKFIVDFKHPVYVRLPRDKFPVIYNEKYSYNFGKWDIVVNNGSDVVIFACGLMVSSAMSASEKLLEDNIKATVINASTIKPLDEDMILKTAKDAKIIVTVEEALIAGGLGGMIAEYVSENCPKTVLRIGINDRFGQSGKPAELLEHYELTVAHIKDKILNKWNSINK